MPLFHSLKLQVTFCLGIASLAIAGSTPALARYHDGSLKCELTEYVWDGRQLQQLGATVRETIRKSRNGLLLFQGTSKVSSTVTFRGESNTPGAYAKVTIEDLEKRITQSHQYNPIEYTGENIDAAEVFYRFTKARQEGRPGAIKLRCEPISTNRPNG